MRVLHSTDVYLPVSQNWIYPQLFGIPRVDTRVICKSTTNVEQFPIDSGRIFNRNLPKPGSAGLGRFADASFRKLGLSDWLARRWAKQWRPAIIHSHFGTRGWEDLHLKQQIGARLVTSFYGCDAWSIPKTDRKWLMRYVELFHTGDIFIVEGPAMKQRLTELGCPEEKIRIVRIGVDLARLNFSSRSFHGPLKIAMLGRFVEKKGLIDGLHACVKALRAGANVSVVIIGDATSSDERGQEIKQELTSLAGQAGVCGHVEFAGFVPLHRAYEILRQQDVFLCPSKHSHDGDAEGGSPVVLTEAMAMGLLCVGTRHCDIPEVIVQGKTGWLCDEGDVDGLCDVLKRLSSDRREMVEIARCGRVHVETHFNLHDQMSELGKIYRSLIIGARTPV
jgi:colanic acid/amylovoran biosynthesis glycosyltransferase